MRLCPLCSHPIPWKIKVDGKWHSLQNRKYCLECSPYGAHNTRPLQEPLTEESRKAMSAEARRAKYQRYQRKMRRRRKRLLTRLLGGRCLICGYNRDCPAAYSFHHRDPKEKLFEVSRRGLLRRWEDLIAEVRKCVLLCLRCHAEFHSGLHQEWVGHWAVTVLPDVEEDYKDLSDRTGSSDGRAVD